MKGSNCAVRVSHSGISFIRCLALSLGLLSGIVSFCWVSRLLILCLLHSGLSSKQMPDTVWCPLSLSLSRSLSRALSLSLSQVQVQVQVQEGPGRE